jgi:hypothetical protein
MSQISGEDRQAIVDVIHRYFWLVDVGRANEAASLFVADGKLTFGEGSPKPGTISGDDIAIAMAARARQVEVTTRHVVSNIQFTANADGSVSTYSLLTLYRSADTSRDTHPASVADIEDLFVEYEGEWRISERLIQPVFNAQG